MAAKKRSIHISAADMCGVKKEWDEALCPICMEHPHNVVLLLCCSHAKGCRPYICDTSYRHSNCLDRFKKLQSESGSISPETTLPTNLWVPTNASASQSTSFFSNEVHGPIRIHDNGERNTTGRRPRGSVGEYQHETMGGQNEIPIKPRLKCPLCRGEVLGQTVVEEARNHLNLKPRSCTRESCTFVGNYGELRRHARSVHPGVRPAEVDPSREQAWRRIEHEREHDDIVSAIHSAMPGAVVLGDYVIEDSDGLPIERERSLGIGSGGSMWNTYFIFEMLESLSRGRANPRSWTRNRHPGGSPFPSLRRRYQWGENLLGLQDREDADDGNHYNDNDDEHTVFADVSEQDASPVRRQRRRLTQPRPNRDRF